MGPFMTNHGEQRGRGVAARVDRQASINGGALPQSRRTRAGRCRSPFVALGAFVLAFSGACGGPGAAAPPAGAEGASSPSGKSAARTESTSRGAQSPAELPDSGAPDAERNRATVPKEASANPEQDCDPTTLEKGLPVYSDADEPAQDLGRPS